MKAALVLALALVVACGPKTVFQLSADENNHFALEQTLARRKLPDAPSPINTARAPRVFAVASGGKPRQLVAFDLAAGKAAWKVDADVQSRVVVGGDFVALVEGKQVVARDQQTGARRWAVDLDGTFVGVAADRDRAYVVTDDHGTFAVAGLDGASGRRAWREATATGKLGAPVAQGGLVYVPYFDQWLVILDGATGAGLTRLRGVDEGIGMVRATSQVVFYGSRQGVFRLDARAAYGTRARAAYAQVKVPPQLERAAYGRDVYDPVQQTYSAFDRSQILYAAGPGRPDDNGPLAFDGGGYAVHYFRYVFGYNAADGGLAWAYVHPRVELVAAEHTGAAILAVSTTGDVVALDPKTGGVRGTQSLGASGQVLGATFDADGYAPAGAPAATETVAALVAIARDRDARFDKVKEYAVRALAAREGPEITTALLELLADPRAPQHLKGVVVDLLVARKDPTSVGVLAKQLEVHADFLAGTDTDAVGAIAKTASGLAGVALDPKGVDALVAGLAYHLDAPETGSPELVQLIGALHAIGGGRERALLLAHAWLYHADDDLGNDQAWSKALVAALVDGAGPEERETLQQLVSDPRTKPTLVAAIREGAAKILRP